MPVRQPCLIPSGACILLAASLFLAACHSTSTAPPSAPDANDPKSVLPDMAKAHKDKVDFAWYVTAPLLRTVDPAIKNFAQRMHTDHERLLARLQAWAKKNQVPLEYKYSPDLSGKALKSMEKMQGDLIQADSNALFQRDYLILTWTDLDWQRNLAQAALATVKDPDLKAYLQDSLDTQTSEREDCRKLLDRFKWQ